MPRPLQVMTHLLPPRYFVTALKAIFLKGSGLAFLAVETGVLMLFGVLVFLAANRKFRKRVV
jgi:ABC-2 type transport system permease protein